jgi:hypothetical protein
MTTGEGPGRPRKPVALSASPKLDTSDPAAFLEALMRDSETDLTIRMAAAKALLSVPKARSKALGVKGQRLEAAEEVVSGRFAPGKPPQLRAVK